MPSLNHLIHFISGHYTFCVNNKRNLMNENERITILPNNQHHNLLDKIVYYYETKIIVLIIAVLTFDLGQTHDK